MTDAPDSGSSPSTLIAATSGLFAHHSSAGPSEPDSPGPTGDTTHTVYGFRRRLRRYLD